MNGLGLIMREDHDGFIRAILEEPEEPEHALIYADWLEEHQETVRAELIRIQVVKEQLERGLPLNLLGDRTGPYIELCRRQSELAERAGPVARLPEDAGYEFRGIPGGLIRSVVVHDLDQFCRNPVWRTVSEPIRELCISAACRARFRPQDQQLGTLISLPETAYLTTLRIRVWMDREQLRDLAQRSLPRLEHLDLRCRLSPPHLTALMAAVRRACPRLRELTLRDCQIGPHPGGARVLAREAAGLRLRALDLGANQLGDAGLTSLGRADWIDRLVRLRLDDNRIGHAGLNVLCRRPATDWQVLDLSGNDLDDRAVARLIDAPGLGQLRALMLTDNRIGEAGARLLCQSTNLPKLQFLGLTREAISLETWRALERRFEMIVDRLDDPADP